MAWFFSDTEINSNSYIIEGKDAEHISKSLRMKKGEEITLVTPKLIQHNCVIESTSQNQVVVNITESKPCENEADVEVILYQALPKGDKMELIIQKAVELGVSKIVPVDDRPASLSISENQGKYYVLNENGEKQYLAVQGSAYVYEDTGNAANLVTLADNKTLDYDEETGKYYDKSDPNHIRAIVLNKNNTT